MNLTMWVANIVGGVGMLVLLLCYQYNDIRKVLLTKFSADCLWSVHYFLIGGYSAMIVNIICAIREIIYIFDKKPKRRKIWLAIFLIVGWIISYFRWTGIVSILPTMVFTIAAYSFWQTNVNVTRCLAIVTACTMFTYDIFAKSYIGMVSESLTVVSVILALVKDARIKRKLKSNIAE